MKVKELIEELKKHKGDLEVVFDSPDRDLWCLPIVLVEEDGAASGEGEQQVVLTSDDQ